MNRQSLIVLLLVAAIVFLARVLSPSDIYDQHQYRTVSYTADIIHNGRWILPVDSDGLPATKPPLYNWIGVPAVQLFGWAEWVLKLPSLLAGAATLIMCWWMTRWLAQKSLDSTDSPAMPALAGIVWLTIYPTIKLAYLARPDMVLVAALTAAWIFGTLALEETQHHRTWLALGFWLSVAAAGLAKGTPAILALIYVVLAARLIHGRFSALSRLKWSWGFPLALAIVGTWIWLAYRANPDHFITKLLGREVIDRQTKYGPLGPLRYAYMMPMYFILHFLPWTLALIYMLVRIGPRQWMKHTLAPAILWVFASIAFFALAPGGRADYIAPAYPAAAAIAAFGCAELARHSKFSLGCASVAGVILAVAFAVYFFFGVASARDRDGEVLKHFVAEVSRRIGNDPVYFQGGPTRPVQTLLGRHQAGAAAPVPDGIKWVIRPVHDNETPTILAAPLHAPQERLVRLGLFSTTKIELDAQTKPAPEIEP